MKVVMTRRAMDWCWTIFAETHEGDVVEPFFDEAEQIPTRRGGPSKFVVTLPVIAWERWLKVVGPTLTGPHGGWLKSAKSYQLRLHTTVWKELNSMRSHPALRGQSIRVAKAGPMNFQPIPVWRLTFGSPEPPEVSLTPGWGVFCAFVHEEYSEPGEGRLIRWRLVRIEEALGLCRSAVDARLLEEAVHLALRPDPHPRG